MVFISNESGYTSEDIENCVTCKGPFPCMPCKKSEISTDERLFAENYVAESILFNSANGIIYNGRSIKSGKKVIIKQIARSKCKKLIKVNKKLCPSEIYYHKMASQLSPGVVQILDYYARSTSYVIVMEHLDGYLDLFEFSSKYGKLNETAGKLIMKKIVKICVDLENGGICHRDIKDENILINAKTLDVKVIDFGCASVTAVYAECAGTPEYFPPEWFLWNKYESNTLTVWSLGCLLLILLCGNIIVENNALKREQFMEKDLSQNAKLLIDSMLKTNPNKRINLNNILKSPWFNNY